MPYTSLPYPRTHPDHVHAMARVFGVRAPDVERCRVLEIGCGSGGNLLAMAATLPRATLVGIDPAEAEIARAREVVDALALGNVVVRATEATEATEGTYDYVIAHGVLSWVTPATRRSILRGIAACLSPDGVAYVSYNVLPGFALRGAMRDILRYHADEGPPKERVIAARTLLSFLSARVPRDAGAYRHLIDEEQERLAAADDGYLFHEHLEEENHPLWFRDFVAEAGSEGLCWLSESDPAATVRPGRARSAIAAIAGTDPVRIEQYFDFLRGRSFRASLLVRSDVTRGEIDLSDLFAVSQGARDAAIDDDRTRTALDRLAMRFPDGERVGDLDVDRDALVSLHSAGLVELRARPLSLGDAWASPLARYQAVRRGPVTNLRHEPIPLAETERQLLALLDGRSRDEVRKVLGARFPLDVTLETLRRLAFLRSGPP